MEGKMVEWAEINKNGDLVINWEEVFENSQDYDHGKRTYDSTLGKLIALVQKEAFEKGFSRGLEQNSPLSKLLVQTGGRA